MADIVSVEVHGLEDIQRKLRLLPEKVARTVINATNRKGANIVKKQIEATAPVRTGVLRKGFKISRSKIHRGPEVFGVYLTLRNVKGRKYKDDPFYGKFQEYGWRTGKKTKTIIVARSDREVRLSMYLIRGKKRIVGLRKRRVGEKQIPGKHFAQAALQSKADAAITAMKNEAERLTNKLIAETGL